jgi:hypothetical protein
MVADRAQMVADRAQMVADRAQNIADRAQNPADRATTKERAMNRRTVIDRGVWAAVAAVSLCLSLHPGVASADGPADEVRFVEVVRANLPYYVIPGGRYATDPQVLASGYRACAELDRSPTDAMRAARAFYPGGNTTGGAIADDGHRFLQYSAIYLCKRHAHLYDDF